MYTEESAWGGLALGILLTVSSIHGLLTIDEGYIWRGAYIPIWTMWLLLPIGVLLTSFSLRAILRGQARPQPPTDEEAARAEAAMDAMYLREHGELPEKPWKDEK